MLPLIPEAVAEEEEGGVAEASIMAVAIIKVKPLPADFRVIAIVTNFLKHLPCPAVISNCNVSL